MANVEMNRQGILDAMARVLAEEGLSPQDVQLGVRSFGGSSVPAVLAFIRLAAWRPEALLRGKVIETRIRDAVRRELGVRVGYVYWRIGGDVETPYDAEDGRAARPSARRLMPLQELARRQGAQAPAHAPVTNWAELDAPTDVGAFDPLRD